MARVKRRRQDKNQSSGNIRFFLVLAVAATIVLFRLLRFHGKGIFSVISLSLDSEELLILPQQVQSVSREVGGLPEHNNIRLTNSEVVYFVLSGLTGEENRNGIRKTWGKGKDNIYFVVGKTCPIHPDFRDTDEGGNAACRLAPRVIDRNHYTKLTKLYIQNNVTEIEERLRKEIETYRDVLQADFVDVYRALSLKVKAAYNFVVDHLPNANWIVKADDDFFVREKQFSNYLLQNYNNTKYTVIAGSIRRKHLAHANGKWKEVPQFPLRGRYPPFPLGCGHAVSRPVAEVITENQEWLIDFQGEDVSLGIWLNDIAPQTVFEETKVMSPKGDCHPSELYLIGHQISPSMMMDCLLNSTNTTTAASSASPIVPEKKILPPRVVRSQVPANRHQIRQHTVVKKLPVQT